MVFNFTSVVKLSLRLMGCANTKNQTNTEKQVNANNKKNPF